MRSPAAALESDDDETEEQMATSEQPEEEPGGSIEEPDEDSPSFNARRRRKPARILMDSDDEDDDDTDAEQEDDCEEPGQIEQLADLRRELADLQTYTSTVHTPAAVETEQSSARRSARLSSRKAAQPRTAEPTSRSAPNELPFGAKPLSSVLQTVLFPDDYDGSFSDASDEPEEVEPDEDNSLDEFIVSSGDESQEDSQLSVRAPRVASITSARSLCSLCERLGRRNSGSWSGSYQYGDRQHEMATRSAPAVTMTSARRKRTALPVRSRIRAKGCQKSGGCRGLQTARTSWVAC